MYSTRRRGLSRDEVPSRIGGAAYMEFSFQWLPCHSFLTNKTKLSNTGSYLANPKIPVTKPQSGRVLNSSHTFPVCATETFTSDTNPFVLSCVEDQKPRVYLLLNDRSSWLYLCQDLMVGKPLSRFSR